MLINLESTTRQAYLQIDELLLSLDGLPRVWYAGGRSRQQLLVLREKDFGNDYEPPPFWKVKLYLKELFKKRPPAGLLLPQ